MAKTFKIFFKNGDAGTITIENVKRHAMHEMKVIEVKRKNKVIAENCDGETFYVGSIFADRKTGLKFGKKSHVTLDDQYYEDLKKTGNYMNPGEIRATGSWKFEEIGRIDITKNHKLLDYPYGNEF